MVKVDPPHQHRMCLMCRERAPKQELARVVAAKVVVEGSDEKVRLVLDEAQRKQGRGAYFHLSKGCVDKLLRDRKRLTHALKIEGGAINEESIAELVTTLLSAVSKKGALNVKD